MEDSLFFITIIFLLILYMLTVFKRGKLEFAKFVLGAITMFFILFFTLEDCLTPILAKLVTYVSGIIGEAIGIFVAYPDFNLIFVDHVGETISLYVDYECAGFIEITIFLSLVAFFPIYKWYQKIWIGFVGICSLFLSNVARIVSICTIVYHFGNSSFYFAHTIVGRFLFYALSMCLYFYIFTKPQIANQRIGRFSYDTDTTK